MRLTLRTLLAYLDDILPPTETKELGEKIAASPVASQLVERIREVMRRRRLTAPETDGSGGGIEPNLVAEYLDNVLPPERVADVERVCLESDVNLAEAAACHQILTLVLGEPVEVPGRLRERMYALGPQGAALHVPEPDAPSKKVRETNAREQLAAIQAAQKPKPKPAPVAKPVSRVPDYLRTPLWKRLLPWAILPLALVAYFALFWNDPTFFGGDKTEEGEAKAVAKNEKREAKPAEPERKGRQPEPAGEAAAVAAVAATAPPAEAPVDSDAPMNPPADGSPAPASQTDPPGDPVAAARPGDPAPAGPPGEPEPPSAAPVPPPIDVFATDGVVLRFDPPSGQWLPTTIDQDLAPGAPIAVPEPFLGELTVGDLPLRVAALGGTRLSAMGATEAAPVGLDVAQGRLRFVADADAGQDVAAMMFALRLGTGLWRIEPLTPDTVFGIEAAPLQPTGVDQDLSQLTPQGVLYVVAGTVRVAHRDGVDVASAGNRLVLARSGAPGDGMPPIGTPAVPPPAVPADAGAEEAANPATEEPAPEPTLPADPAAEPAAPDAVAEDAPDSAEPLPALDFPEWLYPRTPTSPAQRAMAAFRSEFIPDAPATASLIPAVKDRLFYVAEPAAKALGLIENVDALITTLRDAEHQEAILAAADGLRNWLGRSPEHGAILREGLDEVFARDDLADMLYELLWGYGPEDAADPETAERLVEWLAHPEPVVRQLAFYHVKRLSDGRTFNYNPLATEGQRAGAVNTWRAFVRRHGGFVVRN